MTDDAASSSCSLRCRTRQSPSRTCPALSPTPMDSHSAGEHFYETIQILKH